jgi:hypothetical protein
MELLKYNEIMNVERYTVYKERNNVDGEKGKFVIEEKVDGSQFRFGIDGNGNFMAGSKSVNYDSVDKIDKSFSKITAEVEEKLKDAYDCEVFGFLEPNDFIIFYGEYMRSEKHNALKYDKVPEGNVYLFDVAVNGVYMGYESVKLWANILGFEPVHVYDVTDKLPDYDEISKNLRIWKSCLGDVNPEGVVIKNYDIMIMDNFRKVESPLMLKVVRSEFKEILKKDWKQREGKSTNDIVGRIISQVNKNAVWDKAVQHLRDEGKITGTMADMRLLLNKVDEDIEKEWVEIINKELYKSFEYDIRKAFVSGLAEYYKKKLYEDVANSVKT